MVCLKSQESRDQIFLTFRAKSVFELTGGCKLVAKLAFIFEYVCHMTSFGGGSGGDSQNTP